MTQRDSMEVDIVCVGFGPATAGFLHPARQSRQETCRGGAEAYADDIDIHRLALRHAG